MIIEPKNEDRTSELMDRMSVVAKASAYRLAHAEGRYSDASTIIRTSGRLLDAVVEEIVDQGRA